MKISFLLLLLFISLSIVLSSQHKIAITIDDVPNYKSSQNLMNVLSKLEIPVCIFINEGRPVKKSPTLSTEKLLTNWAKLNNVSIANHTHSHLRYSETDFDSFQKDVIKGEIFTRKLAKKYNKDLKYFRFPYNDLGLDSSSQQRIADYLKSIGYGIVPFTIESSDWMYNSVYEYYLKKGDNVIANEIGEAYVAKTMESVVFFEILSIKYFKRNIDHIYMCHDNKLNVKYLPKIIANLKEKKYSFLSLEEVLKDPVYKNENHYYKKCGISWLYRWIKDTDERKKTQKFEPSTLEIEKIYDSIKDN